MATNLAIDDELLDEALKVGGQRTKKATVTQALQEYIQRRRQSDVLKLFGKVEMDPGYDYKAQRRAAPCGPRNGSSILRCRVTRHLANDGRPGVQRVGVAASPFRKARNCHSQSTASFSHFKHIQGRMSAPAFDNQIRTRLSSVSARVRLASASCGRADEISAQAREKSLHDHSNGSQQALGSRRTSLTFAALHNAMHQGAPLL